MSVTTKKKLLPMVTGVLETSLLKVLTPYAPTASLAA